MKSLFKIKTVLTVCLFIVSQSQLFAQSISGTTTICPGSGPVRYTFNPSTCTSVIWGTVQGGPVTIVSGGGSNKFIELQFPTVAADVTYIINAGYNCGGSTQGNATLSVLVKKGVSPETFSTAIPCSFQGNYTFQVDVQDGAYQGVQWSTNTGWLSGNQWLDPQSGPVDFEKKTYGVNNLTGGYVKAVVLGKECNNAPIREVNYTISRTSDLPALAFTPGSVTGLCGTNSGAVSVSPPSQAPSGYRWYSVPANALKINGGFYSSAGAPLTTATQSVTIQPAAAQNGVVTLFVSAVYPGGCGTIWSSRQINLAPSLPAAPTVTSKLATAPGEPTEYLFTATPMTNVIYDWYLGSTVVQSSTNNTFQEYFPCLYTRTYYCIVRNSCGSSAPSNSVTRTGGCRDDRAAVTTFTVSPNPASNVVSIGVKNNTSAKSTTTSPVASFNEVIIYDFNGNPVKRQQYAGVKQGTIDIGNLRTGTYYIEIKNGRIAEKQTLIIQK